MGHEVDLDVPMFCECNDVDCLRFLPIDEEEFLAVRARHPEATLVLVGHEDYVDEVLERHATYLVVKTP
jgi:hypothetical protein